ncbi:MAG: GHMP kinase [Methanocorpusculum sp.]|nr:GHMP kinase [Methanocorpusculum sp.]
MATLKIRGGDLDLVEYDFTSFRPGENLHTGKISAVKKPEPKKGTFRVRAPARIHLTVLDMNRFSPGLPGGGGFGFDLEEYHEATAAISDTMEIHSPRRLLIEHLAAAFCEVTGYQGGFRIETHDSGREHIGLGSTCTTAVAAVTAMNEAVGCPLTPDGVRYLIGYNYVEETAVEGEVVFGFETGVGAMASISGGMNVIGDRLTRICTYPFAEGKHVYILTPIIHHPDENAGTEEFSLLMNRARVLDYRDRELKTYMVMMDFIPALAAGNLRKMGDVMWELEFRGSKRAEVQHHTFVIYQYMDALRRAGLEFVAMSSVGPSVCVVTEQPREVMDKITGDIGLRVELETRVDNTGAVVSRE